MSNLDQELEQEAERILREGAPVPAPEPWLPGWAVLALIAAIDAVAIVIYWQLAQMLHAVFAAAVTPEAPHVDSARWFVFLLVTGIGAAIAWTWIGEYKSTMWHARVALLAPAWMPIFIPLVVLFGIGAAAYWIFRLGQMAIGKGKA
jgi:hypothetical protein